MNFSFNLQLSAPKFRFYFFLKFMPLFVFCLVLFSLSFSLAETWLLTVHFNKNIMSVIMLHYFKFFILLAPKLINLPKTFFFFFTPQALLFELSRSQTFHHTGLFLCVFLTYIIQHNLFHTYWLLFSCVHTTNPHLTPRGEFIFCHKTRGMMTS